MGTGAGRGRLIRMRGVAAVMMAATLAFLAPPDVSSFALPPLPVGSLRRSAPHTTMRPAHNMRPPPLRATAAAAAADADDGDGTGAGVDGDATDAAYRSGVRPITTTSSVTEMSTRDMKRELQRRGELRYG